MASSHRKSLAAPKTRRSPRLVRGRTEEPPLPGVDASLQLQTFMKMTQKAMDTLMREHGFSPQRAQRTLLDHLVPEASSISDAEIFDSMRLHRIGMEQATIALTIEKALLSLVTAPHSASSIHRVLDVWTESLQHVKPMPLREIPNHAELSSIVLPKIQSNASAAVTQLATKSLPSLATNVPSTPAPSAAKEKATPSTSRSKASKKSSKLPAATPPTTITTTQRSRSGSMLDSKLTTGGVVDADGALKGKPPLAPGTATSAATASSKRANAMDIERPSTPPLGSSNKRQRRSSSAN